MTAALAVGLSVSALAAPPAPNGSAQLRTLPVGTGTPDVLCPGAETLVVPKGGTAQPTGGSTVATVVADGAEGTKAGTTLATATPLGKKDGVQTVKAGASGTGVGLPSSRAAGAWTVAADGKAGVVASQSTVARNGDVRGLATTACGAPTDDAWLVGGGTMPGRRLRLLLANPGPAAAVVDLTVHGSAGVVDAPSGDGVVVAPGAQVSVLIDALAPGQGQVAVHVTTRSGRVRATLHDNELSGLIATGADDVPISAAPAKRQVVPGILYEPVQPGPSSTVSTPGGKTAGAVGRPGATAVRVAVPGNRDALVRVQLIGPDGTEDLPGGVLEVKAGSVTDLPIYSATSAVFSAVVTADVPVLASAVVGRSVPGSALVNTSQRSSPLVRPAEFAWTTATAPLEGEATYALPPAPSLTRLTFTATGGAARIGVREVARDGSVGKERVVTLGAHTTAATQLTGSAVGVVVRTLGKSSGVHAAAVSTVDDRGGEMISIQPLTPARKAPAAPQVTEDPTLGL